MMARPSRWWGLVLTLALAAGCEGQPTDLHSETTSAGDNEVSEIALVLPADSTFAGRLVERVAGVEAGRERTILTPMRPELNDPPSQQAELVRQAIARRVSAVIVMPGDPKSLSPALGEARARGIHVVVLGEPVPPPDGPPFTRVHFPTLAGSTTELVDAATKSAEELELPAEGPALIAVPNNSDDPRLPPRAEALRAELQRRGVTVRPDLSFTISGNAPKEALAQAIAESPRPTMILAVEDTGVSAALRVRNDQMQAGKEPPFAIVGYIDNPDMLTLLDSGFCAATVDGNLSAATMEAVRLTLAMIAGREVPQTVEVPTPVRLARKGSRTVPFTIPTNEADLPKQLRKAAPPQP
jgi:ABC-type sugar transport system substrate-binding protein